eukprot:Rhum_TRINITY_DN21812_c0_g1::Rhum_TRINITY_DN21812_c0_g1_i1::g.174745::m.174745
MLGRGFLRSSSVLLNYHIAPPKAATLDAYDRHVSKAPEIVHFTDKDGTTHTMRWQEFKKLRNEDAEAKEKYETQEFVVSLKGVPAQGSKLWHACQSFSTAPLEECENNARFFINPQYGEMILSLMTKARRHAVKKGINPAHVQCMFIENALQYNHEKFILYKAKGFYAEYYKKKYDLVGTFRVNPAMAETTARRERYMQWKYGRKGRARETPEEGLAGALDIPALGVDGF